MTKLLDSVRPLVGDGDYGTAKGDCFCARMRFTIDRVPGAFCLSVDDVPRARLEGGDGHACTGRIEYEPLHVSVFNDGTYRSNATSSPVECFEFEVLPGSNDHRLLLTAAANGMSVERMHKFLQPVLRRLLVPSKPSAKGMSYSRAQDLLRDLLIVVGFLGDVHVLRECILTYRYPGLPSAIYPPDPIHYAVVDLVNRFMADFRVFAGSKPEYRCIVLTRCEPQPFFLGVVPGTSHGGADLHASMAAAIKKTPALQPLYDRALSLSNDFRPVFRPLLGSLLPSY